MQVSGVNTLPVQFRGIIIKHPEENTNAKNKAQKSPETIKRQKIAGFALGGAVLLSIAGVLLQPRLFGTKIKKLLSEKGSNINFFTNFTSAKDAYPKKFLGRFKITDWFEKKTSHLYENTGIKMTKRAYTKVQKLYQKADKEISSLLEYITKKGEGLDDVIKIEGLGEKKRSDWIKYLKELMGKRTSQLDDLVSEGSQNARFGAINQATEGIDTKFRSEVGNCLKNRNHKKLRTVFIAEDLLKNEKSALAEALAQKRGLITNANEGGTHEQISAVLRAIAPVETRNSGLGSLLKRSAKALNRATNMEANDLFDKFRDIKVGCAPVDFYLNAGTLGLTGLYVAQAKNKEERRSVALTNGIPLIIGAATTTLATMKMIAGAKSLLLGIASTIVANSLGRLVDKEYKKYSAKKHDTEVSIPTLRLGEIPNILNVQV